MVYLSCGEFDRAIAVLESFVGLHKGNPSILEPLGQAYRWKGDLPRARSTYEREISELEATLNSDSSPALIQPLENLGEVFQQERNYEAAERTLRRVLAIEENRPRGHRLSNLPFARTLQKLASVLADQEKYVEAEELEKRAIAILEDSRGKTTPMLVDPLNHLAEMYRTLKRYSDAEEVYKRLLGITQRPDTLDRYASLLHDLNRSSEAEELSLQAKTLRERMAQSASDSDQRNR